MVQLHVGTHLVTVFLIAQWVFFSSTIILFNKHILTAYRFPYPATLVLIHMLFASACCTTAKVLGWVDIPQLALRNWLTQILPVGLCFAVSLVLGNAAYLYITVAFVQMLKASTPVAVLLCSFVFGLEKPTFKLAGFIVLISAGIGTACANEIEMSVIGVAVQMSAVGAEALRLCLVNMLLVSKGLRLSSLATLYYGEHARTPTRSPREAGGRGVVCGRHGRRGRRGAWGRLVASRLERPRLPTRVRSRARLRALPAAAVAVVGGAAAAAPPHGAATPRGRAAAAAQRVGGRAAQPLDHGADQAHLRAHAQRLRRLQGHRCATDTRTPTPTPTPTPVHVHARPRPSTCTPAHGRARPLTAARVTPRAAGLILWSVYVSGAVVTPLQYVGYGIALAGVVGFSEYKRAHAAASKVLPSEANAEANAEKVPLSAADADSAADTQQNGSPALTRATTEGPRR